LELQVILCGIFCSLVTRRSDDEEIEDEDFDLRLKQDEKWLHDSPVKHI
jgi:hypothetical protein